MTPALRLMTTLGLVLACAAPGPDAAARQTVPPVQAAPAVETPESRGVARVVLAAATRAA